MTPHTIAPVEEREEVNERQDGKKIEVNCKVVCVERLVGRQRRKDGMVPFRRTARSSSSVYETLSAITSSELEWSE
jgi:hypothetical protein